MQSDETLRAELAKAVAEFEHLKRAAHLEDSRLAIRTGAPARVSLGWQDR